MTCLHLDLQPTFICKWLLITNYIQGTIVKVGINKNNQEGDTEKNEIRE